MFDQPCYVDPMPPIITSFSLLRNPRLTTNLKIKNHKRNGRNTNLNQAKRGGYTDMNHEKSGGYNELQSRADAFITRFKENLLTGERNWEGNLNQNKQLYRGVTLVAN